MHKKYSREHKAMRYIIERADFTADLGQFISNQKIIFTSNDYSPQIYGRFVVVLGCHTRDNGGQGT